MWMVIILVLRKIFWPYLDDHEIGRDYTNWMVIRLKADGQSERYFWIMWRVKMLTVIILVLSDDLPTQFGRSNVNGHDFDPI